MSFPAEQTEELIKFFPNVKQATEGGIIYFLLQDHAVPEGCIPQKVDLLFCSMPRDGYNSRLFFSEQITTPTQQNWNAVNVRILNSNWFAFSWKVAEELTLLQMLTSHLDSLVK
jgi:hypothetical protein